MTDTLADEHEALVQFLYMAPIGLAQARLDGEVLLMNPLFSQLMMPLQPTDDLANLFVTLRTLAPELEEQVRRFGPVSGRICDAVRLNVFGPAGSEPRQQVLSLTLLKLDETTLMACIGDVTAEVQHEHKRIASRLWDMSRIDSLTSLPNRSVVRERITLALARLREDPDALFAVHFVNADRFNRVNLALGYAGGNEVLRMMASRLARTLLPGGTLAQDRPLELTAIRLGGDEFAVLMEGFRDPDEVHGLAQRLVDALYQPYRVRGEDLHLSATVGVALGTRHSEHADAVLEEASIAMREAKTAGGARYSLFEPAMKERAARRTAIEQDLRRALVEHELFVVYQPIVDLATRACVGLEALVRWRHPVRGTVPPIEFIDIAEETGLICALGQFVLDEACRAFTGWQRLWGARAPRTMSVNVSRAQLGDPDLVAQVQAALQANGMPAAQLQLEVTESLAAQGDTVQRRLQVLKDLGLAIALDDFGTGYSSLASLHQLPVDVVKIDRSFVSQIESSRHHRVLVEATILVAESLAMGTVAEGIETEGQALALAQLHCGKGQGYLFAKPMSEPDTTRWLAGLLGEPAHATP